MNHYKKIYIPIFLSMLFHGLFIYFLSINFSKPLQKEMEVTQFVEILGSGIENTKAIKRMGTEFSPTKVITRRATPLEPVDRPKRAHVISANKKIQSATYIPKKAIERQVTKPIKMRNIIMSRVLYGSYRQDKPKPRDIFPIEKPFSLKRKVTSRNSITPVNLNNTSSQDIVSLLPQYDNGATRGSADNEIFQYSRSLVKGAGVTMMTPGSTYQSGSSHVLQLQNLSQYASSAMATSNVGNNYFGNSASFQNASTSGAVNGGSWADMRFHTMVMGKIENAKTYPEVARRTGIEGDVFIRFSIFPDGSLKEVELISPTTFHTILKEAAVSTIRSAAPYLPIPVEISTYESLVMKVKISYRLN